MDRTQTTYNCPTESSHSHADEARLGEGNGDDDHGSDDDHETDSDQYEDDPLRHHTARSYTDDSCGAFFTVKARTRLLWRVIYVNSSCTTPVARCL